MKNTTFAYLILMMLFGVSCGTSDRDSDGTTDFPMDKLVGKWENISKKNQHIEEWEMMNNDHFKGKGFVISEGDTVFIEQLELKPDEAGKLTYFAQVSNQNDAQTIPFGLVSNSTEELVFENPEHGFPQRIAYRMVSNVEMMVYIEGEMGGKSERKEFYFLRKQ